MMTGANTNSAVANVGLPTDRPTGLPLKIFINYRHEDMPFAAMTLYRELRGRFGQENIFFDEGSLRPGMRFPEEIRSHLTDAAARSSR